MKKIFITTVAICCLMFTFLISRLNAQDQPPLIPAEASISMDFKEADLQDILKIFSIQAGMNFISSEAVKDRKITLYLDKVPLSQAMDKIFSANNLSYELDSKANIFVVKEWGKMGTETVTRIFHLKNATVSSSALKEALSKSLVINSGSGGSGETTSSRVRFKEEGDGGITAVVRKMLSDSPVGSLVEDFRTNSLIVTDTPMKMKVIAQVIAELDLVVPQVMLEVEMLDVSKSVVDKMGFHFSDSDTPFTALISTASTAITFPYGSWDKVLGSVYDIQLDFIRTQKDTKFLARPKLLTLNNETAEIAITRNEVVGREDTVNDNGTNTVTTYKFTRSTELDLIKGEGTGIILRVTPQINVDNNEITMVINPKSSVSTVSPLSPDKNMQSDVEVRQTKSIVKVKDGETVILGGLIHQEKVVTMKKLPILGDIPILGLFFRHKDQTAGLERELLVFITPRIVKDKADVKIAQIQNVQLPIREQGVAVGSNRDYIINSNMNKFDKSINGKR
jgi:type II secretory pathway component GspD/PulD (secretin)